MNSALQRARATMAAIQAESARSHRGPRAPGDPRRQVDAFEGYDIPALVGLLRYDVVLSMPTGSSARASGAAAAACSP